MNRHPQNTRLNAVYSVNIVSFFIILYLHSTFCTDIRRRVTTTHISRLGKCHVIPYLSPMILKVFSWWFRRKGWTLGPNIPADIKKCVIIAAPHTSNWDFIYSLGALYLFGVPVKYLAKKELFKWPIKWILTSTGGISIDRSKNTGMVDAAINRFGETDSLYLMIAGEGTRGKVEKWKSGFYHVALGAKVPLMLAYLDYSKKEAGFAPPIYLTGDKEKDIQAMKAFYADKRAKHPDLFSIESIRF